MNAVESENFNRLLSRLGHQFTPHGKCDFAVINTCTVTSRADKKSIRAVRKCALENGARIIFITGCWSELDIEGNNQNNTGFVNSDFTGRIFGLSHDVRLVRVLQKDKPRLCEIVQSLLGNPFAGDVEKRGKELAVRSSNSEKKIKKAAGVFRTRAFIKIQDGCANYCAYCRIPYARGKPQSRNYEEIIDLVKQHADEGCPEIVLCGINMGEYIYKSMTFADMLGELLTYTKNTLVRLSSLEPPSFTPPLFNALSSVAIAPHVHIPLQSGSDSVLSAMGRRYTADFFRAVVKKLRTINPGFAVSTDIIAGFPGETESDHTATLNLLRETKCMRIHVFPFSLRPGTRAENFLNVVPQKIIQKRTAEIAALGSELAGEYIREMSGKVQRFVIEDRVNNSHDLYADSTNSPGTVWYSGTSEYYIKGYFKSIRDADSDLYVGQVKNLFLGRDSGNNTVFSCMK